MLYDYYLNCTVRAALILDICRYYCKDHALNNCIPLRIIKYLQCLKPLILGAQTYPNTIHNFKSFELF